MKRRSVKLFKGRIHHGGRTIMAKKHKAHHDEDATTVDDEPEAGWTEDTHAEQHEDPPPEGEQSPRDYAPVPPPPPAVRLNTVIADLQRASIHNAPVPSTVIKELHELAAVLAQGPAPAMPVIDSVDPATAPEGTINMTVTGQNFSAASVLCYGDVNQTTTVSSDLTQLTATFESGAPGIYDVNVHDPAGDSNTMTFEVT